MGFWSGVGDFFGGAAKTVKMGLQAVATTAGCLPIPVVGDAIEILAEGGAFVAGCCDPTTSIEAEMSEAGIRIAVAAVPIPGSSLAKGAALTALKVGTREFGSAGVGMYVDHKKGKLGEMKIEEFDKILHEGMAEDGMDYNALPEQIKSRVRAQMYERFEGQVFIVDDEYNRLSVEDIAPVGYVKGNLPETEVAQSASVSDGQGVSVITVQDVNREVTAEYRKQLGIADDVKLNAEQKATIKQISDRAVIEFLNDGYNVLDEEFISESRKAARGLQDVTFDDADRVVQSDVPIENVQREIS